VLSVAKIFDRNEYGRCGCCCHRLLVDECIDSTTDFKLCDATLPCLRQRHLNADIVDTDNDLVGTAIVVVVIAFIEIAKILSFVIRFVAPMETLGRIRTTAIWGIFGNECWRDVGIIFVKCESCICKSNNSHVYLSIKQNVLRYDMQLQLRTSYTTIDNNETIDD
jgi:hypothetical protein